MGIRKIKAEIKDAFNLVADDYDPFMEETLHVRAQREMVDKLREEIRGRVLDVGTGTGVIAVNAARIPGAKVTASDFSVEMVKRAVKNAAEAGVEVDFIIDDVEEAPFPGERFDVVISSLGLLWYGDKEKALREMVRVSRRSGKIIIIEEEGTPRRNRVESLNDRLRRFFNAIEKLETPITLGEVEEKMSSMGLTPTRRVRARIDEYHGFIGVVFRRPRGSA